MDTEFDEQAAWFATPLGQRFVTDEQGVVAQMLDTIFGEHLVQIGQWHTPETFLAHARTQKKTLVDWRSGTGADVLMQSNRLAIAADSVDAVILPHTLELVPSPHALLREVGRVLRADGHLIVLSFEANGLWGMRHLFSRRGYPCAQKQLIREGRLRDWLELLSFAVGPAQRFCHTLPLTRFAYFGRAPEETWAARWLPFLRAGICVAAQKRVLPLTPFRNRWRAPRL
ncbi:MAG: methyltransferase domain-containing protein, partial [Gammaproteobacteria bacterium]